jgi:alpha-D-ribose 1-methylphosphonate 5-triphosphate diphosphatase
MKREIIITNAILVMRKEVARGSVHIVDRRIAAVDSTPSALPAAIDWEGDFLIPGLVETHTDNLEKHLVPRPDVLWPSPMAALLAHDAEISCAGITTVLDGVFLGFNHTMRRELVHSSIDAIRRARQQAFCRCEHLIHLRCEVPEASLLDYFEPYTIDPLLKLVSLNDHTPGQRQWRELESYKAYYKLKDKSEEAIAEVINWHREQQRKHAAGNRRRVAELCRARGITLASHDDTREEDVLQAAGEGVTISEFPTTLEAAQAARARGLRIVAGAPNLVRGGSHSGNVSARCLATSGLLDLLSSDYVPSSLIQAAFCLHHQLDYPLPDAIAKVSANPADMIGLYDRGEIVAGKRADLIRVSVVEKLPVVRSVWREGERVS